MEEDSFLDRLLNSSKDKSSARYKKRKGKRFKTDEYEFLEVQLKEELEMPNSTDDWDEIDNYLDDLNHQYNKETDPTRREILYIVHGLVIEKHIIIDQIDLDEINKLYNKLKILYSRLGQL